MLNSSIADFSERHAAALGARVRGSASLRSRRFTQHSQDPADLGWRGWPPTAQRASDKDGPPAARHLRVIFYTNDQPRLLSAVVKISQNLYIVRHTRACCCERPNDDDTKPVRQQTRNEFKPLIWELWPNSTTKVHNLLLCAGTL
jgi:hypothetical protein